MVLEQMYKLPQNYKEIANPQKIIYNHCILKGVQLGVFLGGIYSFGNWIYSTYVKKEKFTIGVRYNKAMLLGVAAGVALSNTMAYTKIKSSTLEQNQSRAWRIYKNSAQNLTDNFTIGGMTVGIPLGKYLGLGIVGGILFGALGGLYVSVVYNISKKNG